MKYFIASRWRNQDIALELYEKLKAIVGKEKIYCFMKLEHDVHSVDDDSEKTMANFEIRDW